MRLLRVLLVVGVVATALVAPAVPSRSAVPPAGIAVPGSFLYGYVTPVIVVAPGEPVLFVNLDLVDHDIMSLDVGPAGRPWCARYTGPCPLFASEVVGMGGQSIVLGTDALVSGALYSFVCSLHRNMTGTLAAA